MRLWLLLAGVNGAVAVAASAIGTHALAARLTEQQLEWFTQAAAYQLWHALALLGIALLTGHAGRSALSQRAGWAFQIGILLFCGTLYWLGLMGSGSLGPLHLLTPMGGLSLIAGWLLLAAVGLGRTR